MSLQFLGVTLKNSRNPENLDVAAVFRNGHPAGYKCYNYQPFRRMQYEFFSVWKLVLCLCYEQCYHHHAFTSALVFADNNQFSPVLFPVSTLRSSSSCLPCLVPWQVISWIPFVGSRKSTKPCGMQAVFPIPLPQSPCLSEDNAGVVILRIFFFVEMYKLWETAGRSFGVAKRKGMTLRKPEHLGMGHLWNDFWWGTTWTKVAIAP